MRWDAIYKRIKNIKNPIGAEVGVFEGELSEKLLDKHPGLNLFMIDAWDFSTYDNKGVESVSPKYKEIYTLYSQQNFEVAEKRTKKHMARRGIVRAFSLDAAKMFEDLYFDFVFIDAAHDEESVREDVLAWIPKIKDGGYICGHDYGVLNFPGVRKAVDSFGMKIEIDEDYTWFARVECI